MLELVDVAGRLAAEDLDRVLVAEVVGALDRVERVDVGVVLGCVSERRVDAALGRAGVASRRVELRDDGDIGARVVAAIAARMPAQPAPITTTSCFASTTE